MTSDPHDGAANPLLQAMIEDMRLDIASLQDLSAADSGRPPGKEKEAPAAPASARFRALGIRDAAADCPEFRRETWARAADGILDDDHHEQWDETARRANERAYLEGYRDGHRLAARAAGGTPEPIPDPAFEQRLKAARPAPAADSPQGGPPPQGGPDAVFCFALPLPPEQLNAVRLALRRIQDSVLLPFPKDTPAEEIRLGGTPGESPAAGFADTLLRKLWALPCASRKDALGMKDEIGTLRISHGTVSGGNVLAACALIQACMHEFQAPERPGLGFIFHARGLDESGRPADTGYAAVAFPDKKPTAVWLSGTIRDRLIQEQYDRWDAKWKEQEAETKREAEKQAAEAAQWRGLPAPG